MIGVVVVSVVRGIGGLILGDIDGGDSGGGDSKITIRVNRISHSDHDEKLCDHLISKEPEKEIGHMAKHCEDTDDNAMPNGKAVL